MGATSVQEPERKKAHDIRRNFELNSKKQIYEVANFRSESVLTLSTKAILDTKLLEKNANLFLPSKKPP